METNMVILALLMEEKTRIALFPIRILQYLISERTYYVIFIKVILLWVLGY